MKKTKKLATMMLALTIVLGTLAGCGNNAEQPSDSQQASVSSSSTQQSSSEVSSSSTATDPVVDEKPWKGMNFNIVIRDDMAAKYGETTEYKNDFFQVIYHALNEWCLENECSWTQIATSDANVMMAAVAGGQNLDLYLHYNQFPILPNLGLVQPIDDYYDELAEKYGTQYLDALTWKGNYYGIQLPSNSYGSVIYDRTLLEEYGVKLPSEYFMEGTWDLDAYLTFAEEASLDFDADGLLDTQNKAIYLDRFVFNTIIENEDGKIQSRLNTDEAMSYYQKIYEAYQKHAIYFNADDEKTNVYEEKPIMISNVQAKLHYSDAGSILWVAEDGHVWESVPVPVLDLNDSNSSIAVNLHNVMIPSSAQNLDASVSIMDYILECICEAMLPDMYDFEGLRGTTDASKAIKKAYEDAYINNITTAGAIPEYNKEYIDAVISYLVDRSIWFSKKYTGANAEFVNSNNYNTLWKQPAATSVTTLYETEQAKCETYNKNYIY